MSGNLIRTVWEVTGSDTGDIIDNVGLAVAEFLHLTPPIGGQEISFSEFETGIFEVVNWLWN